MSSKLEMIRIVRSDGEPFLVPDWMFRAPGRGGYLHDAAECWKEFARRKGSLRSLSVSADRGSREKLVENLRRSRSANKEQSNVVA